jgi:hypothetical protein
MLLPKTIYRADARSKQQAQAVETELQEFLLQYQDLKDDQGRQAVVRNRYLPQRTVIGAKSGDRAL